MRLESERRRLRRGCPGAGGGARAPRCRNCWSCKRRARIRTDPPTTSSSSSPSRRRRLLARPEGGPGPPPAARRGVATRSGTAGPHGLGAHRDPRSPRSCVRAGRGAGQAGKVSRLLLKFASGRGAGGVEQRRGSQLPCQPPSPGSPDSPAAPPPTATPARTPRSALHRPSGSQASGQPSKPAGPRVPSQHPLPPRPVPRTSSQPPNHEPGSQSAPYADGSPRPSASPPNQRALGLPVSTLPPKRSARAGPSRSQALWRQPVNRRTWIPVSTCSQPPGLSASCPQTAGPWTPSLYRLPPPVEAPPASLPNRRAPGSPVSTAAPQPVPGPPASPPNRQAPGSPVSTAATRQVPGPPVSPPNCWAPDSPVSTTALQLVPGPPASPPNRQAPGSPVSTAAPPGTSQASGFLHKISSNSFTVTPRGLRPGSCAPLTNGPLEHGASPGGRSLRAKVPPVPSPSISLASDNTRPKPERSKEIQPPLSSATPSPLQPLSASVLRDGGSFEIRPAPKPDLADIPAYDLQAQALANLRLNSRNSFLFVPRRGGGQCLTEPAGSLSSLKPVCEQQGEPITPSQTPQELLVPVTYIDDDIVELDAGGLPQGMGPDAGLKDSEQPQEATSALGVEASAIPLYRPHPASAALQQRGSNTFTIVPKRKPPNSGVEVDGGASRIQQSEEEDNEESRSKGKTLGSPDAPQLDLGPLLKKRYPTVNEIEVIGGYLSLERSCMSKMGSHRKKMKISFSETSLQTTFEYPSESSLVEEEEEEEEEESASEVEEDEEDKPPSLFIPRPTCTMHANVPSSGFSSYTPKHSVEFSKWQEQEYGEQPASAAGPLLKEANPPGNQVMLTPADHRDLSDFSSEPALYF
nr:taperin [Chelonoidis abingdonii]